MKVNRLLDMITLLLNRGTIPAREFADRFEVSTRTIYRDVEDLSSAGIPVYMSKGKGGGISLLEEFIIDKTLISKEETENLLMAVKTLQATQLPEIDRFLEKLEAIFRISYPSDWVEIEFSPWGNKPDEECKFARIRKAIITRNTILFDYVNTDGEKSSRRVAPLQVIFKSQAWYLRGFCFDRHDFRTFRLSRIKNLALTRDFFNPVEFPSASQENEKNRQIAFITVKLRFAPEVKHRVYDEFEDTLIHPNPDGSCDVKVSFVEDEWVYGFILSFGCWVEVLEPVHLREAIATRMRKALELYR